jgi:hypothetical protein
MVDSVERGGVGNEEQKYKNKIWYPFLNFFASAGKIGMITCDLTNYNGRLLHHEETLA